MQHSQAPTTTSLDLHQEVRALRRSVLALEEQLTGVLAITVIILNRMTDASHLTIEEAARYLQVSRRTVSAHLAQGKLTKEIIPGTRKVGIPTRQLFGGWMDADRAAEIIDARRRAA